MFAVETAVVVVVAVVELVAGFVVVPAVILFAAVVVVGFWVCLFGPLLPSCYCNYLMSYHLLFYKK